MSGKTVTLTLAAAVTDRQTVTLTYRVPTGTDPMPIRDTAEINAAALAGQKVTNESDDTTGPEYVSASVAEAGTSLTIVFDETLDAVEANLPAAARFTVSATDRARFTVGSVAVSGVAVTLTLASGTAVIRAGQTLTLAYTDPNADDDDPRGVVQDGDGNDAADFTTGENGVAAVVNLSTIAPAEPGAPTGLEAEGAGSDRIVLTWDAPADTGGRPITGYRIEVSEDGANGSWTALAEDHREMADGRIVTEYTHSDLDPGDRRHYRVAARNAPGAAGLSPFSAVADATATAIPPGAPDAPTELTATAGLPSPPDGTTLIDLAWMKPADEGDSPITSYRIEWSADGTSDWKPLVANHDTMAGSEIVTGYSDIGLGSETTRHYRVFATNDEGTGLASNVADTTTADIAEPMLQSATVNGVSLVLTYDEDLDEDSEPPADAFTVSVTGATRALATTDPVAVSGKTVTLTLATATGHGETVTLGYTVPTGTDAKPIRDTAENPAAALTGQAVTNNTAANEVPAFTAGLVTTLSIAENSALKTDVGSPFTATDADTADTLTYTLEGTDAGSFSITDKGQIQTNAHIDYEAKTSRSVTVKVSDGKDAATLAVTVNVADEDDTGGDSSLTPSPDDPEVARKSQATYSVRMDGNWTDAVTPAGVPDGAHFTTFVGGIHNDQVAFLEAGETASAGIEAMAEAGATATLIEEVNDAKPDVDRHITIPAPGIGSSSTQTDVVFTSDHPRLTLTSMIAPTPDWFVGVSGLSLLDSSGDWRDSVTVNLYPWDAGTEDGTGFSLTNDETDPQGVIASIRGRGQFTGARIARLVFTRTGTVQLAPAAPAGFALAPADGAVTLGWTVPAAAGITGHEYRQKAGGDYGAWTAILTSAPTEANEDSFTVTGLDNGTLYTFQLRAVNAVGGGVSSAEVAATPNAPASGTVTITGTAEVGQTLTVSVSGVTDRDGVPSDVTYTYQWVRVDGTDETDIAGATSSTYALVAADQGKKVMVKVSFTDTVGTAETLTSEAYPSGSDTVAADDTEPMLQSATVDGASLVLTYDEDLDTGSEPPRDAFTVSVAGGPRALATTDPVDVSGKAVTLTLADAVTDRQTVTLTYIVPTGAGAKPIRDKAQINAAALSGQAVTNNTAATSTDATLSALSLGTGVTLAPAFASATTEYRAWVANSVSSVTVTATKNDDGATVAIANDDDTAKPGTATLSLVPGANTVSVTVTAEDASTIGTYTVTVVREAAAPTADAAALLTANLTVGEMSGFHGYNGLGLTPFGAMTDDDFDVDSTRYVLNLVGVFGATRVSLFNPETVAACFADTTAIPKPPEAARNTLVLSIGSESFRFDAATPLPITTADCHEWARPSALSWSYGDIALVKVAVPAANATGVPAVSGFAQVGKALTAAIGNIADADGRPDTFPDDYTFKWVRVDTDGTSNRTVIAGATSGTYTPDADDLGKRIKVEVSFEDDDGTAEGPLASAATPAVAAAARACTAGAAWCAKLTVGASIRGSRLKGYCAPGARGRGVCTPAVGALDDDEFTLDSTTYTVGSIRWGFTATKSLHLTLDRDFPAASLRGLTLKVDTHSFALSDATRGNDDGDVDNNYRWKGNLPAAIRDFPSGLDVTVELQVSDNNFATGAPAISGTARAGETLTAAIGNIADVDGRPDTFPTDYTLQWVRVDADGSGNPVNIGTDSGTYELVAADVGKKIKVEVSFQDTDGNDEEVTSAAYPSRGTVGDANAAIGEPEISGTVAVGSTLTASPGTIEDPDGTSGASYSYQWLRVDADDSSNTVDIAGATSSAYILTPADAGRRIRVEASFTDDEGNAEARLSDATVPVPAAIAIAPDRPKATGRFDAIVYTLERGPATEAAMVTVTLAPPAGNDWGISDSNLSHAVAFGAGEASKRLRILLRNSGSGNVGFSPTAATGGTLVASLGAVTGYDTSDTAEVEVVVTDGPSWIVRLTQPPYSFREDGGPQTVTIEAYAASDDVPAPSLRLEVLLNTVTDTASSPEDYAAVNTVVEIEPSAFSADDDGIQRGQAMITFTPVQDSLEEGSETLSFRVVRPMVTPFGVVQLEGPDGTRAETQATYPVTIIDDDDVTMPMLSTATVDGASLVLTYDELLDEGSKPPPGAFTVTVDSGDGAEPSMVDVSGRTVTLTLADAVTDRQTVTVTYIVPTEAGTNPIRDGAQHPAAALAGQAVTNNTAANAVPAFTAGLVTTLSIAENSALETDVGSPFTATDADAGDTLAYTLEGTDASSFSITDTGQVQTNAHIDYEARTSHAVTVKVSDGKDSATLAVTVDVADEDDTGGDSSLTPSPDDPATARKSQATYTVRMEASWTDAVTPAGVPDGAHFTTPVGGIHNDEVTFLEAGAAASAGIEAMAEAGTTATLIEEVDDAEPNAARSMTIPAPGIGSTSTQTDVVFTSDHPRITLTSMIAPTPDWFVGVSGLSLLDSSGDWRDSVTVDLYPWDAGTEDGTGFSLTNDETDPQGVIASIRGRGQFTGVRIARLVFTRTGTVQLAPAAPAGFALAPADGGVTLGWTVPAAAGITGHEYRQKAGGDYGAWTTIPDSAPSEANEDSFTVTGLSNGTLYTFQLRAVNAVGGGVSSAEVAATPNAPASGTVTITGTAEVGQTLTVSVSGVTDGDGVPSDVTYTYQWVRVDGTDESDISDATSSTYTLVADDQGKKVMVKVSFTDNTGTAETLTSEAYPSGADTVAADTTEPMLQSATVTGDSLVLTYDELLDDSVPGADAFTVTVDSGDGAEPSMVDVSGKTVTLTLAAAVTDRQTVTLTYRVPTGTDPMPIRDGAQINAAALTDQEVTNNTDDTTPPMLQSATVDGASLVLTYDEDLDSTSEPEPGAFTVSVAGATRALATTDPVTVSGKTVTVTLASAVTDRQTVTLTYRVPTGTDPMPIRDTAEINAAALAGQKVTNESDDTTGPEYVSASVAEAGTSLTIVFDETLDAVEANLPAAARFTVSATDRARFTVGSVAVSGVAVTLTLASGTAVIRAGQTLTLAYTDPNADDDDPRGVVQDDSGNDAADFTTAESGDGAVVNLSAIAPAEPGAPTGLEAEGAGSDRIVLTWDAPADTGGRVITGYRIEVSEDGDSGSWTTLAEDHSEMADSRIVTEYTHSDLDPGDRRHYRVAARNAPGAAGLGSFSAIADATAIPPGAPDAPTELTATAGLPSPRDGTTLIDLAWMKPADEGDSPITSYRIEWSADGTSDWKPLVANHDTMAGSEIVTGYSDTGLGSETTRHYRVFATNGEGTGLASNVADTTTADIAEPVLQSATVNGVSLVLTYDEDLDETSEPAPGAFTVSVAGATRALATTDPVAVSGKTVTLTLASAVTDRQTVTVTYTVPTDADPKPLRDGAQNNAAALTGQAVTNNTAANEVPAFTAGLVTTLSIAENSALKTDVGSPFTATDADTADTLTYTLEGTDAGSFSITDKGQIQTNAHIDYEAKTSRSVTVKVSDGKDSATLAVTVDVADEDDTGEDISLTPSPDDPEVARKSQATYSVRMEASWTDTVTPAGVPDGAHFTTPVGGIHNDEVTFIEAGEAASAGIEAMAEAGTIATLMEEVNDAKPDVDRSMTIPAPGITGSSTQTDVVFTSDHPRITLTSMIAPTPDWFVGVSGLSLLDSSGDWRDSVTVDLYPWDAGTEDGTGFSLTNDETDPQGVIASIRGRGQFTGVRIARLVFTRTGTVQLAPAAPAGFALAPADGGVTLGWTVPAAAGITGHEYRQKAGGDYGAWTTIPDSAPSEANEDSFTVTGLSNGTLYTFQLRAVNAVGGGVSSAEVAATPNAPASGTVTITGTAEVGQTLTVSVSGVTDGDGVPSDVTYTYQWVRVDGTDESDISDATSSTYTLVADDQGKKVMVKVSFTDNTGTAETLTSEAYPSGADTVAADTTEPMLQSATVTGDSLVLTYDELLDDSVPGADAFTVTVDSGDGAEPSMVDVSGKTVTLTLAAAVTDRQTVTLTYRVPTGTDPMPIRDGAQINAAALTDQEVTNNTDDTTPPMLQSATVDGASLVLTYDEDLDSTSEPEPGAFTVSVAGATRALATTDPVTVSGKTVTVTLASAVTDRQTVTLTYRVPTGTDPMPIRDGAQINAAALAGQKVTNESDDTTGPEYVSASVAAAGTSLTIVFDETLDAEEANLPAAARFAVRAGDGARFTVGSVAVSGVAVTLTLASGTAVIRAGQTLTLAYTDPNADDDDPRGVVQDDSGNDAADFTTAESGVGAVVNNSAEPVTAPDAPTGFEAEGAGGDRIRLRWDAPADTGGQEITGYRIEASEDDDPFSWTELAAGYNTMMSGRFEYIHMGLSLGEVRHYRVSARNGSLEADVGEASAVVKATTVHPGAPDAPTGLTATAGLPSPRDGTTQIRLGWEEPADEGDSDITGYRIEVSEDVDPLVWEALEDDTGNRNRAYVDTGLPSETTRHYRVFAINDQGTGLGSNVEDTTTADIAGPEYVSASVAAAGTSLTIVFNETLADASASLPAPGAFTVRTGDGVQIAIDSVSVTDTVMTLSAASTSPTIKTGQTVTVTYTDPSAADDAAAIQDEADNDAASFTLGPGRTVTVTNGSTVPPTVPGAPTDPAVQGVGGDRIALTWAKPRDTGGRAISSYFIEVSEDGGTVFSELVADHNTMVGGEIALRYLHTGLEATDVRHYRVSAKNSVGTGTASITVMGQPVEPIGRVDIAFDTPAATEGIALGWTVTATTLADEQPQSDFALRVAVASEADTAGDADYTRVAETVSFARSDFARRSVGGQMRWVAEKTGQVTTNDDVEVEATETFALTATVTNIVQSRFLTGTGRAEGSIEDNDTWTIEVIADPTSVAEGESRDVKLTARIAPASTECVVPFPVTVSLSATGTATSGTDYRLNGETNDQEIAPCTAETSWPVTMTSNVDTADDDGETVVFTPEIAGTPAIAPEPFQPATVTLRETRGVLLSALSLNAEEGRSTTYTMVLTSRPTGTVTVRPEVSGDMDVTVSPASLAFTPGDWNVRQTVKVHAAPDADEDDDAAEVSHQVSGADYGTNRVSAGSIAISVQDDDATSGELTVGVLVGDAHNSSAAAAPRVHFGEPFTIKLWWSEIRTREWEEPQLAIGADRAIRVTGADVMPVKDDMTDTWSRTSLRLKFTPHGTDDVTLVIEPLDCTRDEHGRYNRHAICGWVGSDRGGNTGLTERVRWTARGVAGAPAAPTNVTVSPGHRVHREQYQVAFDAEPAATRYRVQIQDAGGSWSSPRTLTDDASGRREEVAIEGVSHAQDYDVRVRWENRFGESPWVTVHTSDTLAPPQPTGLTLTQDDDGHSVSLAWTPDTGGTTARYQYRVADEWTDIAQSGPGEANRRAYTVGGLSHTWKMEAQVRGVGPTGRTGEPSETAKVAYTPPHVMEARIRMASSPGSEGHYGVGDRMLVAVPMNRPVRRSGPLPTLDLQIGSTTHALALSRREPSQLASGVVEVPETAVTLYFAHTVTKHDEDTDGVSIPANGLSLNAGQLLDATEDGNNRRATFTLSQPKHFAAHKVQGVRAEVERIEWIENRVWVHYNRDLAPAGWESTGAYIERQFNPTYSVSRPLDRPVLDARIVRGRGWGTPCRHAERGCRTVQLTLRGVVRGNPVISSRATHDAPAPDEQAWMSYAPDPHLEQFRLRDAVGNQVPAFTRIEARHLAAGTDSVLSVASAAGREGRDEAIRFTVRMVPAATSQVTVDYATREGTATANVDYTHVSGTLVFEPGQTAKTIDVPIENDTAKDSGETFTLTLGNPSGARLGDDEALGTIWNDEILSATFDALPDNHDGTTAFTFNLAFSEEIAASANTLKDSALSVAGGTVTEVEQTDAASTRRWSVTVEPWGTADATIAIEVTQSCEAIGAICTSDDLELEERTQAIVRYTIGTVEIAGVPQVGRTLEASLSPAPGGTVTWQWLRGAEEIAGADAAAYTPAAADAGARLAVRAGRGGAAATSAATAPVWPAPVNPPLGAGEEELLSAVLTLEAWHGFTLRVAGYGRVLDSRFGEMDGTAFEDGGTPRAVSVFAVNGLGTFVLATGAAAPRAAGLVAYWNGHRIAGLEAETAGGVAVLSGPTPQPRAAYLRYMDGSSDGVRVAVSLRRTRAAVRVTGAAVTSGPGDNGTWDADEHVEAEVRFSAPVTVTGPEDAAPTLGIALDGTRREAAYTGGSGTGTLSFRYTIAEEDEEDEGAKRARIVADGLSLNGAAIVDGEGRAAGLGFSVAPWVAAVAVEPDASGDGSWTPGETIGVRLTFSEAVTVAGGNPWLDVRIGGFARPLALGYASGSGSAALVFSMEVPRGARALTGIAAVADSLVANGAAIVSEASGLAAELGHDGTEPSAAPGIGEPDPLTAELLGLPDGHGANPFTFELRFSEEFPLGDGGLRDAAFEVTNGAVASVERATAGENRGVERHGDAVGRRRGDGRAAGDDGLRGGRRDLRARRAQAGGGLGDGAGDGAGGDAVPGAARGRPRRA